MSFPQGEANKDVVLTAVSNHGPALSHASDDLKNDRYVVLAAIRENGFSLQYASAELRDDVQVVIKAAEHTDSIEKYASKRIQAMIDSVEGCSSDLEKLVYLKKASKSKSARKVDL